MEKMRVECIGRERRGGKERGGRERGGDGR